MAQDPAETLVSAIREHNPWWDNGTDAFSLPARQKSDFYHLARPDDPASQFEDQPILALVGRRGVGKTTLLHEFVRHQLKTGADPEQFCYLPFDADPLYQLNSDEQLRRAVRYYESRVLGRADIEGPHFLLLDDVHRIEHPDKRAIDGWGTPVRNLLEDAEERHVAVTASAGVQVERELDRVGVTDGTYDVQPILPEKFRDYLQALYPALESGETRVSPSSLREGDRSLPATLETGDVTSFVSELRRKYEQVAEFERKIQSQVVEYLAMGGTISYDRDGVVESAAELTTADYTRLWDAVRQSLYQEVPGFEAIQTIADLERLCALAARDHTADSIRYQELVDLFDVDRRTIADRYLPALADLYVLTGVTEYDNSRPRSVRLFLRDTGLATALADGNATRVRSDLSREADLARVAAFDHTMRFSYGINAAQGLDQDPTVQYWQARSGEVDYVFEVDETPVPVGLAYRPSVRDEKLAALEAFQSSYETPLGLLVVGDTVRSDERIAEVQDGIVQVPYWLYLLLC